ncbi:MAG: HlyD family secretion protein [Enterobacterales bacterium]|jgi:HlyD family secretion protein
MKKILIFAAILIVVIGIPVIKKYTGKDKDKAVEVEQVSMKTIKASILASGQLKHELQVTLTAEVIGKVSSLYVEEGDSVKKGQLLLELDDETFVASVEQQEAAVDQQKVTIERHKLVVSNIGKQLKRKSELYNQKLIGEDEFDSITHQYNVAKVDLKGSYEVLKQVQARLEQVNDQLSKTKVLSPIDGIITSLDIKVGETAISGTTNIVGSGLMTIADPKSMLAEINVDEADIANVSLDQKAEIIAIAFADHPIKGTVEAIASSAKVAPGRGTLSFAVKLRLESGHAINLLPGMSCRAEVFTQGEQSLLALPIKAIKTEEDNDADIVENYVFVFKDGLAKKIKIKTGVSDDTYQQIKEGLEVGASIITGPDKILRHLKDGDSVVLAEVDSSDSSEDE